MTSSLFLLLCLSNLLFLSLNALSPKNVYFLFSGQEGESERSLARSVVESYGESVYYEEMDCVTRNGECAEYRVRTFPCLILEDGERYFRFRDEWTRTDLHRFIGPKIEEPPLKFEGFFESKNEAAMTLFKAYAFSQRWSNFDVEITVDPRIKVPYLNIWYPGENKTNLYVYKGTFVQAEVQAVINTLRFPLMENFSPEITPLKNDDENSIGILFLDEDLPEARELRKKVSAKTRREFFQEITFVVASIKKYARILEGMGGNPNKSMTFALISYPQAKYHIYPDTRELTVEKLGKFLKSFVAKKTRPSLRTSVHKEEEENEGLVKKVYGDTFYDVVMDKKTTVLLYVYDPAQPTHDSFEKLWIKLAENFKKQPHIVFAKLNGMTDEVSWRHPVTYPRFYFLTPELKRENPHFPYEEFPGFEGIEVDPVEKWVRTQINGAKSKQHRD